METGLLRPPQLIHRVMQFAALDHIVFCLPRKLRWLEGQGIGEWSRTAEKASKSHWVLHCTAHTSANQQESEFWKTVIVTRLPLLRDLSFGMGSVTSQWCTWGLPWALQYNRRAKEKVFYNGTGSQLGQSGSCSKYDLAADSQEASITLSTACVTEYDSASSIPKPNIVQP